MNKNHPCVNNTKGDFFMQKLKKYALLFSLGGVGYNVLEILWRGYTHWSMFLAGGLCFIMFSLVADYFKERPFVFKVVLCAVGITAVEFMFGIVFNKLLGMNVWDYSDMPLNFMGQICPYFTLLWCVLALFFLPLAELINNKLKTS